MQSLRQAELKEVLMENKFTPEIIEKARQAKSADEITALAKENVIEKSGELSDDALDNVSGGAVLDASFYMARCKKCGWQSCPFDNKGAYDLQVVILDHLNTAPDCDGDFEVFSFDSRNVKLG